MKKLFLSIVLLSSPALADEYLGQLTVNPHQPNAISPYQSRPQYGGPKLYNSQGEYRGQLNSNQFDPDSVANPYGRYGSKFSPESINNSFGAGNPYNPDSPNNSFGRGLQVIETYPSQE